MDFKASLVLLAATQVVLGFHPVVETPSGAVMGNRVHHKGKDVDVFYGIPYAKPPLGEYRFKKTYPVDPWSGVLNATVEPSACVQVSVNVGELKRAPLLDVLQVKNSSEDCLKLSIWRPATCQRGCKKLPVFAFIYGGAFVIGDASLFLYDGVNFAASTEIVYVTFNYRLGVFGFLNSGTEDAPGNMGLLDQTMALRWIKDNIEAFGGDPEEVTIGGQSAGAISAGYHMMSPLSKGLFKRVIMESGNPFTMTPGHNMEGLGQMVELAVAVGCYDLEKAAEEQVGDVLRCLRKLDAKQLLDTAQEKLGTKMIFYFPRAGNEFLPVNPANVDDYTLNGEAVLMGLNEKEGAVFAFAIHKRFSNATEVLQQNYVSVMRIAVMTFFKVGVRDAQKIALSYTDDKYELTFDELKETASQSFGDCLFNCPHEVFTDQIVKNKIPLYNYAFLHKPLESFFGTFTDASTHAEDVAFLRGILETHKDELKNVTSPTNYGLSENHVTPLEEVTFSNELMQSWAAFIKTGKPKIPKTDQDWPKYTKEDKAYVILKPNDYSVAHGPRSKKCHLWEPYLVKRKQAPTSPAPKPKPTPKWIPEKRPSKPLRPIDNVIDSAATTLPVSQALGAVSLLLSFALSRSQFL
ncbi:acetylcholinesterase-1 [Ixodes scapularis]|uniref:acetylcholinesterase-1 n=1 Tax=Ixodes scapularis TaxID=6945 RepID=UPI001C38B291|nr:acetylcholinesterase-1 [Ixodes scapularis]